MSEYLISTCSTIDCEEAFIKDNQLNVLNYTFTIEGKEYKDDYGKSYPLDNFYQAISQGAMPTTSQINYVRYYNYFEAMLKKGFNILHISMSSGITGSVNNAILAAKDLNDKYSKDHLMVKIVDSLGVSGGQAMLVKRAYDLKNEGLSFEELFTYLENNKLNIHHWFYTMDLTQLIRGGRLSKTAGLIAGAFNICPLMMVNEEGKLQPIKKCLGKKKAALEAIKMMNKFAIGGKDYDGEVYINHSACLDDAETLKKLVIKNFPNVKEVYIRSIGTVIGSHTGKGTVAIFFDGGYKRSPKNV